MNQPVLVPWDDKELKIEFATFRDRIRPGAKETWRVTVKAPRGSSAEARAAELLAYMYDRSLDAFVEPNPPDPLALYPNRSEAGQLRPSVAQVAAQWVFGSFDRTLSYVALHGDRLKLFGGYGIGGPGMRTRSLAMTANAANGSALAAPVRGDVGSIQDRLAVGIPLSKEAVTVTAEARVVTVHGEAAPSPPQLRSDFSETAFWRPQLLTDADGSAVIEFQVPDSVTSWNVWVHAITRDLASASLHKEAHSVKELMVRPYVPRFLREGDSAALKVLVNNASDREMSGEVTLDILDAETNASALTQFGLTASQATRRFSAAAGTGRGRDLLPHGAQARRLLRDQGDGRLGRFLGRRAAPRAGAARADAARAVAVRRAPRRASAAR